MTQLVGIDVSSFQSQTTLAAYLRIVDFVVVKATEGATYQDPSYASHVAQVRASGKLLCHYHFAHPDHGNSPASEVANFLSHADLRPGDCVALDFEVRPGTASWAVAWLQAVAKQTKASPWFYSYPSLLSEVVAGASSSQRSSLSSYPLWLASYTVKAPSPNVYGWANLSAWQYTSSPIDRDVFFGDASVWGALAIPSPTPPSSEDFLMSLSAAQQQTVMTQVQWLYDRCAAMLAQRYYKYVPASGSSPAGYVVVPASDANQPNVYPCRVLDTMDGNSIQMNIDNNETLIKSLAAQVAALEAQVAALKPPVS